MQWASWSAFWEMGGAAAFVWGSYAVTAVLVALEAVLVLRRRGETLRRLQRWARARADAPAGAVQRPRNR